MRALCRSLGIAFDEAVTVPTFNGDPIESNSSFEASKGFINAQVLARKSPDESAPDDRELFAQLVSLRTLPQTGD